LLLAELHKKVLPALSSYLVRPCRICREAQVLEPLLDNVASPRQHLQTTVTISNEINLVKETISKIDKKFKV